MTERCKAQNSVVEINDTNQCFFLFCFVFVSVFVFCLFVCLFFFKIKLYFVQFFETQQASDTMIWRDFQCSFTGIMWFEKS